MFKLCESAADKENINLRAQVKKENEWKLKRLAEMTKTKTRWISTSARGEKSWLKCFCIVLVSAYIFDQMVYKRKKYLSRVISKIFDKHPRPFYISIAVLPWPETRSSLYKELRITSLFADNTFFLDRWTRAVYIWRIVSAHLGEGLGQKFIPLSFF